MPPPPFRRRVSIHAPARGATEIEIQKLGVERVSIHAPARGATGDIQKQTEGQRVSIHAPARGATDVPGYWKDKEPFQSTPPRGGRRSLNVNITKLDGFNPRPRAGGDVRLTAIDRLDQFTFQSTPPRGGRPGRRWRMKRDPMFQSTPPRGGRPSACGPCRQEVAFQSTPPRGGRLSGTAGRSQRGHVSIHAPARGAT